MKAIVCGGRIYSDREHLEIALDQCLKWWNLTHIITGGAKGADSLAHAWALSRNLNTHVIMADWDRYGKGAGAFRNILMLKQKPNVVIAFKGGTGTEHMITISRQTGVPVFIV